eukprot:scaffold49704_cov50-Cyclotella_meneghiniana.AAC.5
MWRVRGLQFPKSEFSKRGRGAAPPKNTTACLQLPLLTLPRLPASTTAVSGKKSGDYPSVDCNCNDD